VPLNSNSLVDGLRWRTWRFLIGRVTVDSVNPPGFSCSCDQTMLRDIHAVQ